MTLVQQSGFSAMPLRVHTRPDAPYYTVAITVCSVWRQDSDWRGYRWTVSWKAADGGPVATFYGSGAEGSVDTEAEAWAAAAKAVAEMPERIAAACRPVPKGKA